MMDQNKGESKLLVGYARTDGRDDGSWDDDGEMVDSNVEEGKGSRVRRAWRCTAVALTTRIIKDLDPTCSGRKEDRMLSSSSSSSTTGKGRQASFAFGMGVSKSGLKESRNPGMRQDAIPSH